MINHTPVPWRINGGRIEAGGEFGTDSFEQIALVGFANAQSPVNTANARLIAAAPELLAALDDLLAALHDDHEDCPVCGYLEGFHDREASCGIAEAALAKATEGGV